MPLNPIWRKIDPLQGLNGDILRYLDSLGFWGWQLGLERIKKLCAFLGHPHSRYPCVHIAGTNGKGSTAAMLAAIGKAAGLKTGLYTSPHLVHIAERIQINGQCISNANLARHVQSARPVIDDLRATYFEALTAIAFAYFAEQEIDLAIIETGLGGRLDATNVIMPEVAIITSLGLEHQQYLGKTLAAIAQEKAGIIKAGRPCVNGVKLKNAREVIRARCRAVSARFVHAPAWAQLTWRESSLQGSVFRLASKKLHCDHGDLRLNLLGRHQIENARLAMLGAHFLRERGIAIDSASLKQGLAQVQWPTRMQLLPSSPPILIDAAHNPAGMRTLVATLQELFPKKKVRVVMALLKDKSARHVLRAWQNLEPHFFFVSVNNERAMPPEQLLQAARQLRLRSEAHASACKGFKAALHKRGEQDLLVVAGSHYLLGELMSEGMLPYPYSN